MSPYRIAAGHTNNRYSVEPITAAIEAYLRGEGSIREISKRFGLCSNKQFRNWIKVYNGHKEFRPSGGLTDTRKRLLEDLQ